jgi:hypothetical protein
MTEAVLPDELIVEILKLIGVKYRWKALSICKKFQKIIDVPQQQFNYGVNGTIFIKNIGNNILIGHYYQYLTIDKCNVVEYFVVFDVHDKSIARLYKYNISCNNISYKYSHEWHDNTLPRICKSPNHKKIRHDRSCDMLKEKILELKLLA